MEQSLVKPENIEILQYGQEACKDALDMLNELLEIEKKDNYSSGYRITELSHFIATAILQLKALVGQKEIVVETDLTTINFFARVHQHHLKRVIHNLIANAVKFSHQGGRIMITSEIKKSSYILAIKDEGIGIPFDIQGAIFGHFTPSQRQGTAGEKSTGLGLYFTKETIAAHGGRIWFESAENAGSIFLLKYLNTIKNINLTWPYSFDPVSQCRCSYAKPDLKCFHNTSVKNFTV